jgi:hypothetical protein
MSETITIEALARELAARGVPLKGAEPMTAVESNRPWFIGAVLGVAGWFAGMFALGFMAMLFNPQGAGDFGVIGVFMLGAAVALYTLGRGMFVEQLALALLIAAEVALLWAVGEGTDSATATSAIMAALELALLAAIPNRFAKSLSAFLAIVAWAFAVRFALWDDATLGDRHHAIPLLPAFGAWLAIWVPLIAATHFLVAAEARWVAGRWRKLARPTLGGLLAGLSLATWASEPFDNLSFWAETSEAHTNFLVHWPLLATGTALFAAVSAYRLRDRPLVGVAVVGALLHMAQFYYGLGVSLLAKSVLLGVLGGLLLVGANVFARRDAAGAGGTP